MRVFSICEARGLRRGLRFVVTVLSFALPPGRARSALSRAHEGTVTRKWSVLDAGLEGPHYLSLSV